MLLGKVDYIYEFRKYILEYYGKELSRSLYIALARLIVASSTEEDKEKLRLEYARVQKAYDNMKDKTAYIFRVSEEKKRLANEIEKKGYRLKGKDVLRELQNLMNLLNLQVILGLRMNWLRKFKLCRLL